MERIIRKIERTREYLRLVRSIEDECLQRFQADPIYRGALLHYLYLISDSCIAVAELVIRHRKLRLPQTYAEAFDILGENGVLEPAFAYEFSRIAGFRNFLAHDYESVDPRLICNQILPRLIDIDRFLESMEVTLNLTTTDDA
jgi:uncharacterized protein YutE (UPF0331/DUF86 family)